MFLYLVHVNFFSVIVLLQKSLHKARLFSFVVFLDGVHWCKPAVFHSWLGAQRTVRFLFLTVSVMAFIPRAEVNSEKGFYFFHSLWLTGKEWSTSALVDIVFQEWTAVVRARPAIAGQNGELLFPLYIHACFIFMLYFSTYFFTLHTKTLMPQGCIFMFLIFFLFFVCFLNRIIIIIQFELRNMHVLFLLSLFRNSAFLISL